MNDAMKHIFSAALFFSLFFLSACTTASNQMMPPFKDLSMQVQEQQSFHLGNHSISVNYLQAEPNHLVEIMVDGVTEMITVEEHQVCPEKKAVTKKIIDKQGNMIGEEQTFVQEQCWYSWNEDDINFHTFLD